MASDASIGKESFAPEPRKKSRMGAFLGAAALIATGGAGVFKAYENVQGGKIDLFKVDSNDYTARPDWLAEPDANAGANANAGTEKAGLIEMTQEALEIKRIESLQGEELKAWIRENCPNSIIEDAQSIKFYRNKKDRRLWLVTRTSSGGTSFAFENR